MKTKIPFFQKFFVLLFTAFIFNTSAKSEIIFLTANGNNTSDTSNTFIFKTAAEYMHWVNTGDVPAGVVAKPGTTAAQLAEQSKQGAAQVKKCLVNNIVHSNDITKQFGPAITNQAELDKAFKAFEATLFVALVDFKGGSVNEMQLTYNTATKVWGNNYSSTGHHASVGILPCLVSRQTDKAGKVHEFIIADARCGQPFGSKSTMMALELGSAVIVATAATPNTPASPSNAPTANNGNVGGAATGNGNVTSTIPIPNSTTGGNIYITTIAGNGNGNGSSNGGQGGYATGGTATANNTLPTGGAATGATTGGFNFGIVPGAGVAQAGTGYTTTSVAPNGATAASASSTTTTTTGGAAQINYKPELRAIAAGTFLGPLFAAGLTYGLSWIPRPGGGGGNIPIPGGGGGGLVTNPG